MSGAITRAARSALPWLAILALSAGTAHAIGVAVSTADRVGATQRPALTPIERPRTIEPCDDASARLLRYAVSNGWLSVGFEDFCQSAHEDRR
jgi:hypothetical protein